MADLLWATSLLIKLSDFIKNLSNCVPKSLWGLNNMRGSNRVVVNYPFNNVFFFFYP